MDHYGSGDVFFLFENRHVASLPALAIVLWNQRVVQL